MIGSCSNGTCNGPAKIVRLGGVARGTCHIPCKRQRAFTLLEVLLTMCLLVILASLAWTALDKPFAGVRLRKAADRIRAELVTARVEALESGDVYFFRCTVNEGGYRIDCYSAAMAQGNSALGDVLGNPAQDPGTAAAAIQTIEGSLPEDVTFVICETVADARSAMIASELEQSAVAETGMSDPILFYPDGTASTARLVLKNEDNRSIELLLRGLTGVVNIGEVGSSAEPMQ